MSLKPFTRIMGVAAPMLRPNIDTDAIIPSREMKRVSKQGLGEGLFAGERYLPGDGRMPNPEFVLNQADFADCAILLAGPNFGCGSSREHAVWALHEFGIRCIIAAGFGTIFANNCIRNGLLPVQLPMDAIESIANWVRDDPQNHRIGVDLENCHVQADSRRIDFTMDPEARHMLLNGIDAIELTLQHWSEIEKFHHRRQQLRPWLAATPLP